MAKPLRIALTKGRLKSAGKKTQPAAKMVIQEIHIALIVRK